MSEQALDLRRSVQVVRRHWKLVSILALLGLLAGAGFGASRPVMFTSKALVVLPQSAPSVATEAAIAASDPVLSRALPSAGQGMTLQNLRSEILVKSVTNYILSISATASTAAAAEAAANAVARSYVAYVTTPRSPVGRVSANVLQPAATATSTARVQRLLIYGLLGAVAGALIGAITALVISRTDRRLRARDEIANSIGIPVLASIPVRHPSDAAGWSKLLDDYEPGPVHMWQLRNALQQLGLLDVKPGNGGNGDESASASLAILSLGSDPRALALGPQVAVFAASLGIPTALVVGPQQDVTALVMLRTACSAAQPAASRRQGNLHVGVFDRGDVDKPPDTALTVFTAAVDSRNPWVAGMMQTTVTVLGVSAGAATAEQLARAAAAAAADGREIAGIFVADPEAMDRTTGRIPQQPRATRRRMPGM